MKFLLSILTSFIVMASAVAGVNDIVVSGNGQITGNIVLAIGLGSGITNAPPGSGVWVRTLVAGFNVFPASVAADSSDNALGAGGFSTSINMGGGVLPSAGALDIFMAKYSSANAFSFGRVFGTNNDDRAFSIAADSSGNVFIAGSFKKDVDFGGILVTNHDTFNLGTSDIFVCKYSSAGALQWAKGFGSFSDDSGYGVAADASGNVILVAAFVGTVNFGGTTLVSTSGSSDIAVVKLSGANGATMWAFGYGGTGFDVPNGVALDGSGNPVVVGSAGGAIDLGGGSIGTGGQFIAKYNGTTGAYSWAKVLLSSSIGGVAVEASTGKVFVTGGFTGSVDFGGGSVTTPLGANGGVYTAAYNSAGTWIFQHVYGGNGDLGAAVAVDTTGLIAVTGSADGLIDFSGQGLYTSGRGYFVHVMTTAGANQWYGRSTASVNHGYGVAFSASHLYTTGGYQGTVNFGGINSTVPSGLQSGFITQYVK